MYNDERLLRLRLKQRTSILLKGSGDKLEFLEFGDDSIRAFKSLDEKEAGNAHLFERFKMTLQHNGLTRDTKCQVLRKRCSQLIVLQDHNGKPFDVLVVITETLKHFKQKASARLEVSALSVSV